MFTVATCTPPSSAPADLKGDLITSSFSCVMETEKHRCIDGGGACNITSDGKLIQSTFWVVLGGDTNSSQAIIS